MKHILFLISIWSLFSACKDVNSTKKQPETISETEQPTAINSSPEPELKFEEKAQQQDTIYNYWEPILDTIEVNRKIEIGSKNYSLKLKTYSLNDSAIVRALGTASKKIYLDHSHTMVTDFELESDSLLDEKRIDRTFFEDALFEDFYQECNLISTEIDSINANTIYLTTDLGVPDSDNLWRVWYTFKIINDRMDSLDIKSSDYVGL